MKTSCHIIGRIQRDANGNIFCQEVLLPNVMGYYVGYTCTITEIENNLKVEEMPEYPYFCSCPSSIDVQIPVTVTVSEDGRSLGGKYLISDRQEIAEGTNITIKKIRPIIEKGTAFWGTILQYDKVEEKAQEKSNVPSIEDFQYLLEAGYKIIFDALEPAMKYYQSDPKQSCVNFRSVLKLTVVEAEGITHCTSKGGLYAKLKNLCSFLSERNLLDSAMNKELWVVKTTSDPYHHPEDHPDLNPKKDRYTFYCAFQEIFKWLMALPEAFAAFIRARDEKQARIEAEREKRAREAKERAEAERKAIEEHKKQEEADRKRLERNAKERERRKLAREAKERELRLAAEKAQAEAKAAEKEAKKELRKIKWQKGVEAVKKKLPIVGYTMATIAASIVVGVGISLIGGTSKNN